MSEPTTERTSIEHDGERLLAIAALLRSRGCEVECRVQGDSMAPTLPDSALVRIRFATDASIAVGQIAAFVAGRHVIAHRVLHRGRRTSAAREHLLTGGDATVLPDPPVRVAAVLGPVIALLEADTWSSPAGPPPIRSWRRAVRGVLVAVVAGTMLLNVRLAAALTIALIRTRRRLLGLDARLPRQ